MQHLSNVSFESFYLERPYNQELVPAFQESLSANFPMLQSFGLALPAPNLDEF